MCVCPLEIFAMYPRYKIPVNRTGEFYLAWKGLRRGAGEDGAERKRERTSTIVTRRGFQGTPAGERGSSKHTGDRERKKMKENIRAGFGSIVQQLLVDAVVGRAGAKRPHGIGQRC